MLGCAEEDAVLCHQPGPLEEECSKHQSHSDSFITLHMLLEII